MAKKRPNLDLNPEAMELLRKLAIESEQDASDILRKGMELYGIQPQS